jgi:hypothetical protein
MMKKIYSIVTVITSYPSPLGCFRTHSAAHLARAALGHTGALVTVIDSEREGGLTDDVGAALATVLMGELTRVFRLGGVER